MPRVGERENRGPSGVSEVLRRKSFTKKVEGRRVATGERESQRANILGSDMGVADGIGPEAASAGRLVLEGPVLALLAGP